MFQTHQQKCQPQDFPPEQEAVIKRAIHTTADFDYADNLVFSENAVKIGIEALKNGADIEKISLMDVRERIGRLKYIEEDMVENEYNEIQKELSEQLKDTLKGEDDDA